MTEECGIELYTDTATTGSLVTKEQNTSSYRPTAVSFEPLCSHLLFLHLQFPAHVVQFVLDNIHKLFVVDEVIVSHPHQLLYV